MHHICRSFTAAFTQRLQPPDSLFMCGSTISLLCCCIAHLTFPKLRVGSLKEIGLEKRIEMDAEDTAPILLGYFFLLHHYDNDDENNSRGSYNHQYHWVNNGASTNIERINTSKTKTCLILVIIKILTNSLF